MVMLSAVDGPPWTKCGSHAWSGGPSVAATLGPGGTTLRGPLVV